MMKGGSGTKGILQSQGRLLRKMRFMPSSLLSNSHRLLTALVDSRHKKVYKVKNCFTDIDPEREKEQKEKAESQTIRANELLTRKKEKVNRKYPQTDDEPDYHEMEARAEKRIMNAKKPQGQKDTPRKPLVKSSRPPIDFSDSEREESEYETEGEEDERAPQRRRVDELEEEDEYEEDDHDEEERAANEASDEEPEEPKQKTKEFGGSLKRKGIESDEESPPRKMTTHRRMAVIESDEE
ncbi:hypothetical protein RHSIM_RhsimUnG0229200 [Rhododendron simsii]|uniref:Uncharacterized protein n=1 Tax=Rhododendron simsii TaxID=118357 RepID=A0A834FTG0_RHOSS|nr:hypothetical protein RHSIM_RhsimUnG0229200 [Rhododendron simsii]